MVGERGPDEVAKNREQGGLNFQQMGWERAMSGCGGGSGVEMTSYGGGRVV